MRLESFHPDVRQLLLGIGSNKVLTGDIQWVSLASTQGYEWLRGKVQAAQLHQKINDAVGECASNRGDLIIVAPGHVEDLGDTSTTGAINLNVAGIDVVGLGRGTDMPRIDFNDADSDFLITAPNIGVEHIHLEATVTGVKLGIAISALGDWFEITDCRFTSETTTTDEFLYSIAITAAANNGTIQDCMIDMGLGGATGAVHLNGASTNQHILRNEINGAYSTAGIVGSTAASTVLDIGYNRIMNGSGSAITTEPCIELNGNSTGLIYNNYLACNLTTKAASCVATLCLLFENYYNEDVSGASTGGIIGTASADG